MKVLLNLKAVIDRQKDDLSSKDAQLHERNAQIEKVRVISRASDRHPTAVVTCSERFYVFPLVSKMKLTISAFGSVGTTDVPFCRQLLSVILILW